MLRLTTCRSPNTWHISDGRKVLVVGNTRALCNYLFALVEKHRRCIQTLKKDNFNIETDLKLIIDGLEEELRYKDD